MSHTLENAKFVDNSIKLSAKFDMLGRNKTVRKTSLFELIDLKDGTYTLTDKKKNKVLIITKDIVQDTELTMDNNIEFNKISQEIFDQAEISD